jgi:hypothetical protein
MKRERENQSEEEKENRTRKLNFFRENATEKLFKVDTIFALIPC